MASTAPANLNPNVNLNPKLLEDHYLVRPNRPWAEIEDARARLKGLSAQSSYEGMETDAQNVENYSTTVQESSRAIGLAICLATHLRRFVPGNKFEDAMKALSSGLEFQSLDAKGRRSETERCMRALLGGSMPDASELDAAASDLFASWAANLDKWLRLVGQVQSPSTEELRAAAWAGWMSRLQAFIQNRDEPADLDYLRCRAEGSAAGALLTARLSRLTLGQLSDAFTTALAIPDAKDSRGLKLIPGTFALALLAALRFDVNNPAFMKDPEVGDYYSGTSASTSSSPPKGLVVIRSEAGSVTANWKVIPTVPTLCTTLVNAQYLFTGRLNMGAHLASRIYGVLFEVDRIDAIPGRAPLFQAFLKRFPADLAPRGGLIVTGSVPNQKVVPEELRRFAVGITDQSQAISPLMTT